MADSADLDLSHMTTAELATQRTNVEAAIAKAEKAVAYSLGGRALTRPSLEALYKRHAAILRAQRARGDTVGPVGVVEFGEPQ